jgi:hypothetical protein
MTEKASSKGLAIGPELGVRLAALTQAIASTDSGSAELEMTLKIEAVWQRGCRSSIESLI